MFAQHFKVFQALSHVMSPFVLCRKGRWNYSYFAKKGDKGQESPVYSLSLGYVTKYHNFHGVNNKILLFYISGGHKSNTVPPE